jgi:hypothetical protein
MADSMTTIITILAADTMREAAMQLCGFAAMQFVPDLPLVLAEMRGRPFQSSGLVSQLTMLESDRPRDQFKAAWVSFRITPRKLLMHSYGSP